LGVAEKKVHAQIADESFKLFYKGTGREPKFGD
jgi:glutaredoxin-related protein